MKQASLLKVWDESQRRWWEHVHRAYGEGWDCDW